MTKRNATTWPLVASSVLATGLLLAGCGTTEPADVTPETTESQEAVTPDAPESTTPETPAADPDAKFTFDEAAKVATDKYGGTVKSVESDTHDGEPTWEVELEDSSEGRIEVNVSKATGEIVSVEQDD